MLALLRLEVTVLMYLLLRMGVQLRLFVGQHVCVRFKHATSGWWEGTALGSGESGVFPDACVKLAKSEPEAAGMSSAHTARAHGVSEATQQLADLQMASSLPHLDADAGAKNKRPSAKVGGVGIWLSNREGKTCVSGLVPGFPAHLCSQIHVGDVLIKVDRLKLNSSLKLSDVNTLIRGTAGTSIELALLDTAGTQKDVTLRRVANSLPRALPLVQQNTPSRANTPWISEADLYTPQKVYDMECDSKIIGARMHKNEHPLQYTPHAAKTPKTRVFGVVRAPTYSLHSLDQKHAFGKRDLRTALVLRSEHTRTVAAQVMRSEHTCMENVANATAMAEDAIDAAETAHLAANWMWQEICKLRDVVSMEQGKTHAAIERASDAQERSAYCTDQLSKKDQQILELHQQCRILHGRLQDAGGPIETNRSNATARATDGGQAPPTIFTIFAALDSAHVQPAKQHQTAGNVLGSARSQMTMGSSRSVLQTTRASPRAKGGTTAVQDIGASVADGITSAFAMFNPFGAMVAPTGRHDVDGGASFTSQKGPNLPFMLQRNVNETPFVQDTHRTRNERAPNTGCGETPAGHVPALWELGADISPAVSPTSFDGNCIRIRTHVYREGTVIGSIHNFGMGKLVYVYTCIYVYIYIHVHILLQIFVCIYICIYI